MACANLGPHRCTGVLAIDCANAPKSHLPCLDLNSNSNNLGSHSSSGIGSSDHHHDHKNGRLRLTNGQLKVYHTYIHGASPIGKVHASSAPVLDRHTMNCTDPDKFKCSWSAAAPHVRVCRVDFLCSSAVPCHQSNCRLVVFVHAYNAASSVALLLQSICF